MSKELPKQGWSRKDVLSTIRALKAQDVDWRGGRVFSMVYYAGEDVEALLEEASRLYFAENALNPGAFPGLRRMETEVVAMTARLLGGDDQVVGSMTSGGTESLLLAVKTARDWGRAHRNLSGPPEVVLTVTAHPAFEKAAHYFGVKLVYVPVGEDDRPDPAEVEAAITENTVLVVGSAPSYPHGVMDPIPEMAAIAQKHGVLMHVDACVGGFLLPFWERLGEPVPPFDFRVPGVTSISADVHKYGYAAKGASVVLYRSPELRRYQFFVSTDWPGGIYASPALLGTRAAGPIAAAWAVMHYLGEEGYLRLARQVRDATRQLQQGIRAIPGLTIVGEPVMSVFAVASERYNIYEIADEMALRGWHLDRQHRPPSLHITVMPVHAQVVEPFLADLRAAVAAVQRPSVRRWRDDVLVALGTRVLPRLPRRWRDRVRSWLPAAVGGDTGDLPQRAAPLYGLMGALPTREDVREAVLDLLDQMFRAEG